MRTLEMKIVVPEVNGGRCISAEMKDGYILAKFEIEENETSSTSESELECKIEENETSSTSESELECKIEENKTSSTSKSELECKIEENETSSTSESELECKIEENETSSTSESELECKIEENETSSTSESELECKIEENKTSSTSKSELECKIEENKTSSTSKSELKCKIEENKTSSTSENELECKIDPNIFEGAWLKHRPNTTGEEVILTLYQDAKAKGRLHTFTCMTIDPSVKDGKLVYQKGLPTKTGFSQNQWAKMLKDYNPSRNSRQMTRTEYVCRNLFLIQRLVESGYEIDEAWKTVCEDSIKIGHYCNSQIYNWKIEPTGSRKDRDRCRFDPTGSREVCGFCDLGDREKLLAEDPWRETGDFWTPGGDFWTPGGFWIAGGSYLDYSFICPVARHNHVCYEDVDKVYYYAVGMIALD